MNTQAIKRKLQFLVGALTLAGGSVIAGPLPSFDQTVDFNSQACANYGDFQFCSAQYLNFLATGDPKGDATTNFVVQSSQGLLMDALVVITASNAAVSNTDIGTNIDNAYKIISQEVTTTYGTSIGAGEKNGNDPIIDPSTAVTGEVTGQICGDNGTCAPTATTAWDIGLQALIDALTFDSTRRDLYIFFDNNQVGVTEGQNILVSGLVCVQDAENVLPDVCFELVDQNGTNLSTNPSFPANLINNPNPTAFNTVLDYGDPLATDTNATAYPPGGPVLANGTICVDAGGNAVAFNVQSCPAGTTLINNNLGSNVTEFIGTIPELNSGPQSLEALLALGYDLISVQLLFLNQNDGFEDVFLLAGPGGPPVDTPEPGTLLLLGLGALGLGLVARRRKS